MADHQHSVHSVTAVPDLHWPQYQHNNCLLGVLLNVSMAEQVHASLTSPSTVPSVGWSGLQHTPTGVWSSENVFCGVMNHVSLSVWWMSVGLMDVRRTIPAWLRYANCYIWWRKVNDMGLFFMLNVLAYQDIWQLYASNFVGTIWGGPFLL